MELLIDALIDSLKLIPLLFITYLFLELLEHKASYKLLNNIQKYRYIGPIIGSLCGLLPQCGFSSSASSLYVTRIISKGTLISIYLATSDEMLPILLANNAPINLIFKILFIKFTTGLIAGFIIDLLLHKKDKIEINNFCISEHCNCQDSIFKSALKHTIKISSYIFIITLILNILLSNDLLYIIQSTNSYLSIIIASLIGLIPNCASSVALTNLYLDNILPFSSMIAGLLTNAGVGLLVLFKLNKNIKDNLSIIAILLLIANFIGIILK